MRRELGPLAPRAFDRVRRRATAFAALMGLGGALVAGAAAAQVSSEELPAATPAPPAAATTFHAAGQVTTPEGEAEAKYAAGDLEGAAALYRQLAVATPAAAERLRLLIAAAWLEHQLARDNEAFDLLRRGLGDAPDYPFQPQNYSQEFVGLYLRARDQALADRRQRAKELVQRSLQASAADDLPRARTALVQALALVPDDSYALYYLALADMKAGRRDEAAAGFERLLSIDATQPGTVPADVRSSALASLGKLYLDKNFLEDAQRYLEQAVALDPASGRIWNTLGVTLRKAGDAAGAERAFRKSLELAPDDLEAANNLALVLSDAQRWSDAVTLMSAVTSRAPQDGLGWLNLALAQRGVGDRAAASASLQRVLTLDPQNQQGRAASAAVYLAIVRYELGDAAGAAAAARQALAWRPDDVSAWTYLGLAQQNEQDHAGARDSFRRALALDPARPENHNNLGSVLVVLGDLAGAAEAFQQALTIRPDFAIAQTNLDQVRARQLAAQPTGAASPGRQPAGKRPAGKPGRQAKPLGATFSEADFTYLGIHGAVISSVAAQSPAERAGLRKGDVVLGVDEHKLEGSQYLHRYLRTLTGERDFIELDILREGQPRRIRVHVF